MTTTDLLAHPASHDWHRCLARLIQGAGSTSFPGMLEQDLRERLGFDSILVNTYKGGIGRC